ncbi:MAG: hypothetical protein KDD82_25250 [Planctomycetes bacterium]|nr:hypothetical protein [Planctomycetota bacterium]
MDKRQTQLRYDVYLSPDRSRIERILLTTAAAAKPEGQAGLAKPSPTALTSDEHVAFRYDYTFSEEDAVGAFEVPQEAAKLLR